MTRFSTLHIILGLAAGLLVVGSHGVSIAQGSLNIGGSNANYGVHAVSGGFVPDPMRIQVTSGGNLNVRGMRLGRRCVGHATSNPDVIVNYTNPARMLRFFVQSSGDTALVINDPRGRWKCHDDVSGSNRNPMVTFNRPRAGQYDIWVTSYSAGENLSATLNITELRNQRPSR